MRWFSKEARFIRALYKAYEDERFSYLTDVTI
jgi:hypothetical protein